ncbi:MAG: AbiV family abortive infection protein [Nitrospinota bacterium]
MYQLPPDLEGFLRDLLRKVIDNARRLVGDAVCLFERGSYPSAQFLALSAMEEMAKLQEIRRPFVVVRTKEDLDDALGHLESYLAEHREKQTTAFQAAPYLEIEDPKEWGHIVDMVSRLVRTWGREKILKSRISSLVVDADVRAKEVSDPAEAVTREDAYYFICAAHEMIADYGDKGLDPFPLAAVDSSEGFDLWKWADEAQKDFMKKHAIR